MTHPPPSDGTSGKRAETRSRHGVLGAICHEIRTPLACVLGFTELLGEGLSGPLTDRQQTAVREIAENGTRLLALIEQLPDVVAVLDGTAAMTRTSVAVDSALAAAASGVHAEARARDLTVTVDAASDGLLVMADPHRLDQMLGHLLRNAVASTPAGGTIRLAAGPSGHAMVDLSVTDTGCGIAEADQPRIFEPFVRVDDGSAARRTAAGLGLALVRALTAAQGGTVRVESRVGAGSCFTLTLPRAGAEPTPAERDGRRGPG